MNKTGSTRYIFPVAAVLLLAACSGIKVSQDYEKSYNFAVLKTFAWKPNDNNDYGFRGNELVDKRIRSAIVNTLAAKQYTFADSAKPDFYISYHVTVEQKIDTHSVGGGIAIGRGSRGRYGGVGIGTGTEVHAYKQGTLLIDVTDVAGNFLAWRGISTQPVSEHSDPEKSTKRINETVEKVLSQFPPH